MPRVCLKEPKEDARAMYLKQATFVDRNSGESRVFVKRVEIDLFLFVGRCVSMRVVGDIGRRLWTVLAESSARAAAFFLLACSCRHRALSSHFSFTILTFFFALPQR